VPEPDVLRFPISLLTAAALVEGVKASLDLNGKIRVEEARWLQEYAARRRLRGSGPFRVSDLSESRMKVERQKWVARELAPIIWDIQHVLEIDDVRPLLLCFVVLIYHALKSSQRDLTECREWLTRVSDSHV
jgi:hypothetical protein